MNLIIVGCGRVGRELGEAVLEAGHSVTIVDRDQDAFLKLGKHFQGRTIQGDARDRKVLERAGIDSADGLAAVTPNDEINLIVGRAARKTFGVQNVVARVYDPKHQPLFELAGLQTVMSSTWGAQRAAELLMHTGIIQLASLGHGEVLMLEVRVSQEMAGRQASTWDIEGVCEPAVLIRAGQARIAEANTVFEENDLVVLAVEANALPKMRAMLSGEAG